MDLKEENSIFIHYFKGPNPFNLFEDLYKASGFDGSDIIFILRRLL